MKNTTFAIMLVLIFGGVYFLTHPSGGDPVSTSTTAGNVTLVDGKQIVEITAQGGYEPATSQLQPGIPTILRFKTDGTYDCSSAVRIPSLGVSKTLSPSGTTDIEIGILKTGNIQGTCGMGMYHFALNVEGTID